MRNFYRLKAQEISPNPDISRLEPILRNVSNIMSMQMDKETKKIGVILIEDLPLTQAAIKHELQRDENIEWLGEADDGVPGIALIKKTQADVAIVDYHLNTLDGLDLIEMIVQASSQTKIISLTQEENPFLLLQIIEAGSKAVILKKFRRSLKEIIYHVFNGGTVLQKEMGCEVVYAAKEREILNLLNNNEKAYFEKTGQGKNHVTIAEELGIKESSVKKLLTNAKNKLKLATKKDLIDLYKKFFPA